MKSKDTLLIEKLLQEHSYRLTTGRIALLLFLSDAKKPLSATDIQKNMNQKMDKVTLYRALENFSKSNIITKVNLKSTSTYYELIRADRHHHHIVCEQCGKIEDIENCDQMNIQKEVLSYSKSFKTVTSHSLEFFGVCKMCSN